MDLAQIFIPLLCLLASAQHATAQFVEISAQIELAGYRSGQTNGEASAKPRSISVLCITGANRWRIESGWVQGAENKWFFDGTNVYESLQATRPISEEMQEKIQSTSGFALVRFQAKFKTRIEQARRHKEAEK